MARFISLNDEYINVDQIIELAYDSKSNITDICTACRQIKVEGDVVSYILNANNEVTMHDKLVCRYMVDKLKSSFSTIIAKLDALLKLVGKKQ